MLKAKAVEFAQRLGSTDFEATDRWLSQWKVTHDIRFKPAHGEKSSADRAGAEEWIASILPELLREYNSANIYNANETGLYYNTTPDISLCYAYDKLSSSKKAMDCITVLGCANKSGSDKCKLLVISKSKKTTLLCWN